MLHSEEGITVHKCLVTQVAVSSPYVLFFVRTAWKEAGRNRENSINSITLVGGSSPGCIWVLSATLRHKKTKWISRWSFTRFCMGWCYLVRENVLDWLKNKMLWAKKWKTSLCRPPSMIVKDEDNTNDLIPPYPYVRLCYRLVIGTYVHYVYFYKSM